jgi:hypothetical protein
MIIPFKDTADIENLEGIVGISFTAVSIPV